MGLVFAIILITMLLKNTDDVRRSDIFRKFIGTVVGVSIIGALIPGLDTLVTLGALGGIGYYAAKTIKKKREDEARARRYGWDAKQWDNNHHNTRAYDQSQQWQNQNQNHGQWQNPNPGPSPWQQGGDAFRQASRYAMNQARAKAQETASRMGNAYEQAQHRYQAQNRQNQQANGNPYSQNQQANGNPYSQNQQANGPYNQNQQANGPYNQNQQTNGPYNQNQQANGPYNQQQANPYGQPAWQNQNAPQYTSLPKSIGKRRKILNAFNEKYKLYITDEQASSIVNSSYVSVVWRRELEAMNRKYETAYEWFQGPTGWLRVYMHAFHNQELTSDIQQQETICMYAFESIFQYVDSLKGLPLSQKIELVNDRFMTSFDDASFMIAYRFLASKGLVHELIDSDFTKNVDEVDDLVEKYQKMEGV